MTASGFLLAKEPIDLNIYIAGICGTFMGGVACLARELGYEVAGYDTASYPPMDGQLRRLGVAVDEVPHAWVERSPDKILIGNALSRGHALVEHVLSRRWRFISGPQWLYEEILHKRDVAAVAGTHGKTTTTAMLSWILASEQRDPGFLVGGAPGNFDNSARLGTGPFIVEADEYDTAFYDKRPKFMHYFPRVLVLNNLDFDHADIFADLDAIKKQFGYLLRTVPENGRIIWRCDDNNLGEIVMGGAWATNESFGRGAADWRLLTVWPSSGFEFHHSSVGKVECRLPLPGEHNALNALAAIAAAAQFGVEPAESVAALERFRGVSRRLEVRVKTDQVTVYDDFAHHPGEISASLQAVREAIGDERLVAVFEPRSNTMKMGCHNDVLEAAFSAADRVLCYSPPEWRGDGVFSKSQNVRMVYEEEELLRALREDVRAGGHYVVMSNGGFFNVARRLAEMVSQMKSCG